MSIQEENKQLVTDMEEIEMRVVAGLQPPEDLFALFAPELRVKRAGGPESDLDAFKAGFHEFVAKTAAIEMKPVDMVAAHSRCVVRYRDDLEGGNAGAEVEFDSFHIFRIKDGLFVEAFAMSNHP